MRGVVLVVEREHPRGGRGRSLWDVDLAVHAWVIASATNDNERATGATKSCARRVLVLAARAVLLEQHAVLEHREPERIVRRPAKLEREDLTG